MNTFWKAVIALLAVGVVVSLFTLLQGDRPIGSENLIGKPLPAFAAPLATGSLEGDANVYTDAQAKQVNATPACAVKLSGSFNSCTELKGDAIVQFWNSTKGECVQSVDQLNEFAAKHPDVEVVALAFDQEKAAAAATTKSKGWKIPVAVDPDGAVAALYSVAGCPSTFFARDGEITGVKLGVLSQQQLADGIQSGRD